MLLSITTTYQPATDLGYLLYKHPEKFQTFDLSFGQAHVFYPEATQQRCTACLLVEIDPVRLIRSRSPDQSFLLAHYVNDRPYVASSFLSVAIAQVYGTALQGRCKERPELAATPLPLTVKIDVLPVRSGESFLYDVFAPLGYQIEAHRYPLDSCFPEWGDSPYYSVTLQHTIRLAELLSHLYVLMPVFDNFKHYYVGEGELEKLLQHGSGWLAHHPWREEIVRRYLLHQPSLCRLALARLMDEDEATLEAEPEWGRYQDSERLLEQPLTLNEERIRTVLAILQASGARSVLDLGCGEGNLLATLLQQPQYVRIVGMDVSLAALEKAEKRLQLGNNPLAANERLQLWHGSLLYRDRHLEGFDAAVLMEVIEHFDVPRLPSVERVVWGHARPRLVIVTTPNREYNVLWPSLPVGSFRHPDHRFEWTRQEFQDWANKVAIRFGYSVRFLPVGSEHPQFGPPTQLAVFQRQ